MYEFYFNWKFIWKKVGFVSFIINLMIYYFELVYWVNLLVISSKEVDFFFKMWDMLISVMIEKLEFCYFWKGVEEGKCYIVDEVCFLFWNGMCYVN